MADRVVLHVGTMKSGTTSMQALLFAAREELAAQGVRAPGERWEDQVRAVRDILADGTDRGATWQRLREEAEGWPGTAVYSMEYLGTFSAAHAAVAARSFGETPVEVVITFRDLNRTLASMWQETIQNGRAWSWHDFLAGARALRPGRPRWRAAVRRRAGRLLGSPSELASAAGRNFWLQHDVVRIARTWASVVGEENVTLVAVPGPGAAADELTRRFAEVVGFDAATIPGTPRDNSALGAVSVQLLREVNVRLAARGLAWDAGREVRKFALAKQILRRRGVAEQRIGLDVAGWVRAESAWRERELRASRMRFVGEWPDVAPAPVRGVDPETTADDDLVEAAGFGFRELAAEHGAGSAWPATPSRATAVTALADLIADLVATGSDA